MPDVTPLQGWMRATLVRCPVCGASKHEACLNLNNAGKRLSYIEPHITRIIEAAAKVSSEAQL